MKDRVGSWQLAVLKSQLVVSYQKSVLSFKNYSANCKLPTDNFFSLHFSPFTFHLSPDNLTHDLGVLRTLQGQIVHQPLVAEDKADDGILDGIGVN